MFKVMPRGPVKPEDAMEDAAACWGTISQLVATLVERGVIDMQDGRDIARHQASFQNVGAYAQHLNGLLNGIEKRQKE